MQNPFKYGGIVSGPYFAGRTEEIKELQREMENNSRVFLVSPRRFGKTCLLHHLIQTLTDGGTACAYIDLNGYPDVRTFASALTSLTSGALETNSDRLIKLFAGFQRLRPKVSIDPDGNLSAGLELAVGDQDALSALIEGMAHAESLSIKKGKKLVIIIDEFSDLEKYNGRTLEKALRAEIQKHRHIGYIFSGSEQSIMLSMTQDSKRAFYKLGRIMALGPIKRETYIKFILSWFKQGGYAVTAKEVIHLITIGEDVPYNVQRLCNAAWEAALESKAIDAAVIKKLPLIIVRQDSPHYEMLWQTATTSQRLLLMALAENPEALLFSKDFQMRNGIGPSSSIKASLDSLLKKGILYKTLEGHYHFVDRFMPYWLQGMRQPSIFSS